MGDTPDNEAYRRTAVQVIEPLVKAKDPGDRLDK